MTTVVFLTFAASEPQAKLLHFLEKCFQRLGGGTRFIATLVLWRPANGNLQESLGIPRT